MGGERAFPIGKNQVVGEVETLIQVVEKVTGCIGGEVSAIKIATEEWVVEKPGGNLGASLMNEGEHLTGLVESFAAGARVQVHIEDG